MSAIALIVSAASSLYAQPQFPLPAELPVEREKPIWDWKYNGGYFANDADGTTWYITQYRTWSFSPDSMKWTQWPKVVLEDVEVQLGYDKANERFLFWNVGVGKVFTWNPGDTTVQRIDKSFHHRTQFGHAWFIHPKTGEIYAFGGFGFWQSRGYTSRFDKATNEWQILVLDASKPFPSARAESMFAYDEKRNQFHIFGGKDYRHDGRDDLSVDYIDFSDYWVLDVERHEWTQYPVYGLDDLFDSNREQIVKAKYWSAIYSVVDPSNDLAWYPIRRTDGMYDIQLMVFDYKRDFGAYLPISLGDLGIKSHIVWYDMDSQNNQILIYWMEATGNVGYGSLRVSALPLPHPDSTRAMMDMMRTYGSIDPPARATSVWLGLIAVLVATMIGGGWLWQRRSRRPLAEPANDAPERIATEPVEVTFCLLGQPRLLVNGTEVRNHFSELELGLLFWLYWKGREGQPFQITDEIERVFWRDAPNLDYIRKQRNTTLRRLNEQLTDVFKDVAPGHDWIVDRTSITDKRKREYALQFSGVVVHCDLDGLSVSGVGPDALLTSCQGHWVDQIRRTWTEGLDMAV